MEKEIFKLALMLHDAKIFFELKEIEKLKGYQICIPKSYGSDECIISVVQHKYSCGGNSNLLEIYEISKDDTEGWLTAEDVLKRIKNIINKRKNK